MVERYQPGQVQARALPSAPQPRASAAAFGAEQGQALQRAGQGMVAIAGQVDQTDSLIAEARAKDADTQFMAATNQLLHAPETGYYAKRGRDAIDATDETVVSLEDLARQHEDGLDDQAKRMYRRVVTSRLAGLSAQIGDHRNREALAYDNQSSEARIANLGTEAEDNWARPSDLGLRLSGIRGEILDMSRRNGWAPEVTQERLRTATSDVHRRVALRMTDSDPVAAEKYLADHAGAMQGGDWAQVHKAVKTAARDAHARDAVARAFSPGLDVDTLTAAVERQESGGRDLGADGVVLTSSAGAKGRMQVMDGTNRDPGFGVAPAQDDSLEERARVGREYLKAMTDRYDGSPVLALAAYNAGPARIDEWLKTQGDPRTGKVSDAAWIAKIPFAETRDYVASVLADVGARRMPQADAVVARARAAAGDDLAQADANERLARVRLAETEKAQKAEDEQVLRQANALIGQGVTPDQFPRTLRSNPAVVEKMPTLWTAAQAMRKGPPAETDWGVYEDLRALKSENPKAFAAVPLITLRDKLGDAEFKEVGKWQEEAGKGKDFGAGTLDQQMGDMFDQLGIKDKTARGRLSRQIALAVDDFGEQSGKKPTFDDRQKIVDRLALDVARNGFWGESKTGLAKIRDISDVPKGFVQAFRAKAPGAPDQAVLDAFFQINLGGTQ
jgi:hypothetical protein